MAAMLKREFTGGDETRFHALYSDAISTDLMFLASKMRAAASRGELDRLEIDPELLARKDEFIAMQARRPQEMADFFTRLTGELAGKRVFMIGAYNLMHEVAAAGLARGMRHVFAPDSAILTGGGMKGFALPANYMEVIREFLGVDRIQEGYGMSEISTLNCTSRRRCHRTQSSRSAACASGLSTRPATPPSFLPCGEVRTRPPAYVKEDTR